MTPEFQSELDALLGGLCNGTLQAAEYARLDALVRSEEAARRFYNDYLFLHAELYSQHAALATAGCEVISIGEFQPTDDDNCGLRLANCGLDELNLQSTARLIAVSSVEPSSPEPIRNPKWRAFAAIAAALVGVAALSSWLTYAATQELAASGHRGGAVVGLAGDSTETGDAKPESAPVAKITATRNCLWASQTKGVGFGSSIRPGQRLHLDAGLVEITFDDGAKVVLEGPARFDVRARGEARLHEGRLAAVVPQEARGFAVATSRLNVVDLGTEFGLMSDAEGTTEVHVFNGLVEAHLLDERGLQVRTVSLNTAEAARVRAADASLAMITARDDQFVRSLSVASGPHDGLYAYDGFNYPSGPLSEQNGGFGWGGPWFNLAAAAVGGISDANGATVGGISDADDEIGVGDASHKTPEHTNGVRIGSLEYEGMVPLGNRAVQAGQQNRIRRSLSTSIGGVFDAVGLVEEQDGMRLVGRDGTTVYLSFLQRVDRTADVFYGLELHRSDGNPNRVLCIGHGAEETGYGATSNFNVYGPRNSPSLGEENTDTNFFVVRITFGAGNRDRVEVIRNPESLFEESACEVDSELLGNFSFDRIGFGNYFGTKIHEIDEIRVGTTFLAVTGRRSRGPDRLQRGVAMLQGRNSVPRVSERGMLVAAHLRAGSSPTPDLPQTCHKATGYR